jgi:hypothetical protein
MCKGKWWGGIDVGTTQSLKDPGSKRIIIEFMKSSEEQILK